MAPKIIRPTRIAVLLLMALLNATFFAQDTLTVARNLLGQTLVRTDDHGRQLRGTIVETEAYLGQNDSACHAARGRTRRTEVMFGPAGRAYVYFVYGMHHMFNIVTEAEGRPCAVLIRAIAPLSGHALMEQRRRQTGWAVGNGPAKLCQALAIDRALNSWDLTSKQCLWLEKGPHIPESDISRGPRVRIDYATPADRQAPWRFWISHHPAVSR